VSAKPPPPEQLRAELERLRRGGVAFERAWPVALRAVQWQNGPHRVEWFAVLSGLAPAFEAAYERKAAPAVESLAKLDAGDFPDPRIEGYRHQTRGHVGARAPTTRNDVAPVVVGVAA
jgi:hypothetical protein